MSNTADAVRARIRETPLLSHSAIQLVEIAADADHTIADVLRVVEVDSVLTGQVLRVVNSAALGIRNEVTSIERALAYLGDKIVVGIAIAHGQSQVYGKPLQGYGSEGGGLWEHSLRTAIAARHLAEIAREPLSSEIAYTGGILHDIGKATLSEFIEGKLEEILAEVDADTVENFLDAEAKLLGVNHCDAGAELAAHWSLPSPFSDICAYHHRPQEAPAETRAIVTIVHVADIVAMLGGSGTGADTLMYGLDPSYQDVIDISKQSLDSIVLKTTVEFEKARLMFGQEA